MLLLVEAGTMVSLASTAAMSASCRVFSVPVTSLPWASLLIKESNVAEAVADCTLVVGTTAVGERALQHPLHGLQNAADLIGNELARAESSGRVALLFGSEKTGLSNEELSHCNWLLTIPMQQHKDVRHPSMNLGQAIAVCLYELIRNSKAVRETEKVQRATAEELERITMKLLEAMRGSGYLERRPIADVEERMRRLVRRLNLPARDAVVWLGILRQIGWKLRGGKAC